jgi:hypothetical protein
MSPVIDTIGSVKGYGWGAFVSTGPFESIATVTVGTTSLPTITFSSIPSTYTHLQLRVMAKTTRSAGPDLLGLYMNGSTSSDYADNYFYGDGTTPSVDGNRSYPQINVQRLASAHSGSNIFSCMVIDILDYANTNKFKTVRYLGGFDANGSGRVGLGTGLWRSTNAISSLNMFSLYTENFGQYSQFALYGIKTAA